MYYWAYVSPDTNTGTPWPTSGFTGRATLLADALTATGMTFEDSANWKCTDPSTGGLGNTAGAFVPCSDPTITALIVFNANTIRKVSATQLSLTLQNSALRKGATNISSGLRFGWLHAMSVWARSSSRCSLCPAVVMIWTQETGSFKSSKSPAFPLGECGADDFLLASSVDHEPQPGLLLTTQPQHHRIQPPEAMLLCLLLGVQIILGRQSTMGVWKAGKLSGNSSRWPGCR